MADSAVSPFSHGKGYFMQNNVSTLLDKREDRIRRMFDNMARVARGEPVRPGDEVL